MSKHECLSSECIADRDGGEWVGGSDGVDGT